MSKKKRDLPRTGVARPWGLVRHGGQFRLVYLTSLFGTHMGTFNGGRCLLVTDAGEFTTESETPVVFTPVEFVYDWQNQPTSRILQKARERAEAEQGAFA